MPPGSYEHPVPHRGFVLIAPPLPKPSESRGSMEHPNSFCQDEMEDASYLITAEVSLALPTKPGK